MILRKLELGSFGSNCYIIGDEASKEGMIIDPGDEGNVILKQVKALGLKIKVIVLTHSHIDHIGGLEEVKKATGAEIAIHQTEAPFLLKQPFRLDFMPPTPPSPPADRLLKEGDVITIGKLKFKVLHTPGHTPEAFVWWETASSLPAIHCSISASGGLIFPAPITTRKWPASAPN